MSPDTDEYISEERMNLVADRLAEHGFKDGTDASVDISLFEYGIIRNPTTNKTIFYGGDIDDRREDIFSVWTIEYSDIYNTIKNIDDGYFSYIGLTRADALEKLDNDDLSAPIFDINAYNGEWRPEQYAYTSDDILNMYPEIPEYVPEFAPEFRLHADDSDWIGELVDNNTSKAIIKIVSRLNEELKNDLVSNYRSYIPKAEFEVRKYTQNNVPAYAIALTPDEWTEAPGDTHWRYVGNIQHAALRNIGKDDDFTKLRQRFKLEPGTATPLAHSLDDLFDYWSYIEGLAVPKFAKEFVLHADTVAIVKPGDFVWIQARQQQRYGLVVSVSKEAIYAYWSGPLMGDKENQITSWENYLNYFEKKEKSGDDDASPVETSDIQDILILKSNLKVPTFTKEFKLMATSNQYEIIDSASYKFVGGKHNKYYTITIWDSLVFNPSVKKILDNQNIPYLYTTRWGRRNMDDPMRDYDCLTERTEVMIHRIEDNIKQGQIGNGVKLLGTMGGQGQMFIEQAAAEKKRDQKTGKGYQPEGEASCYYEDNSKFFWDVLHISGSCGNVSPMVKNNVLANLKKPTLKPSGGIPTYAKVFRLHAEDKWSPKVKEGALEGWSKDKSATARRRILAKVMKKSDYATVIRRLNWLRNISQDKATDAAAIADMKYLQKQHKSSYASPMDNAPGWVMPALVLGVTAAAFVFFTKKDAKPDWMHDELAGRY